MMNKKKAKALFHAYLFNKSGMLWDPLVVEEVFATVANGAEDIQDIRDLEQEFSINYDGRYLVSIYDEGSVGQEYYRITMYPMGDDVEAVWTSHCVGEAYIHHNDWERIYKLLRG